MVKPNQIGFIFVSESSSKCCTLYEQINESICAILKDENHFTSDQLKQILYTTETLKRVIHIQVSLFFISSGLKLSDANYILVGDTFIFASDQK